MRRSAAVVVITVAALASLAAIRARSSPADEPAPKRITLMETLAPWQYPGAKFGGASMSDGGNPKVQAVKCQAILTTADPAEKVAEFYAKKFEVLADRPEPKAPAQDQCLSLQDDSRRPVALRVICVHRADTSTTLVISRGADETETHIAWSHYLRFGPKH